MHIFGFSSFFWATFQIRWIVNDRESEHHFDPTFPFIRASSQQSNTVQLWGQPIWNNELSVSSIYNNSRWPTEWSWNEFYREFLAQPSI